MNFGAYAGRAVLTAVDLVNTRGTDRDDLTAEAAAELLAHRGWVVTTAPELARLRALRDTLRHAFDTEDEREVVRQLNHTLAELRALPQLTDHDGGWHWHYAPEGAGIADRVAATTSAALLAVIADGGAERLRVCTADRCRNVFVDLSRNGSRRYCSSRACGNRTHAAAYRARLRDTPP
ncbi:CGNR zinc finger domain-containing protein [Actinophytocola sediminis]